MANGESTNNNGKWSFERILLVLALGGNIGLGGVVGLSGGDDPTANPHPDHAEKQVPLSETCEFKLFMCQFEMKELQETIEDLEEENDDLNDALDKLGG